MSPFSSSFPPQPRVYSRNQLLLPSSASRGANISPFSARCAYFPSQRGLVYPLRHLITLSFEGCSGLSDLCAALFPVSECSTPLLPITSLQPQQFHAITHSFAQRRAAIPPIFNGFRTLSIATRVYYPPNVPFGTSPPQCLGGKSHVLRDLQPLCRLFALFSALPSFVFNTLQPLLRKHPGGRAAASRMQSTGQTLGFTPVSSSVVCVPLWQIASQPKPQTGARRNETSFTGRIHPAAVGKSTARLRTSS